MIIRKAVISDLPELLAIYNYEVINGIATLDIEPRTLDQRRVWFDAHNIGNHPLYVAIVDDRVAGYASLSSYREKEAYSITAELSVYVDKNFRGRGIAAALVQRVIDFAKEDSSLHTIVSVITKGNTASIRLNEKFGFEYCGTIKEAAVKFGKYIDILNYRLTV